MKDMIKVLALSAFPTFWLLVASLLINILALASAIYVIQVLNRYITYQIDATLYVLTIGVLIALILEYILRVARHTLAEQIVGIRNREHAEKIFKHASRTHLPLDTNQYQTTLMRSFTYIKEKGQISGAEGIVSFKDKEKAEKKAKSLAAFINGFKAKKDASEIIIEEARRSKRKKESFRWVVQPSFYN